MPALLKKKEVVGLILSLALAPGPAPVEDGMQTRILLLRCRMPGMRGDSGRVA